MAAISKNIPLVGTSTSALSHNASELEEYEPVP